RGRRRSRFGSSALAAGALALFCALAVPPAAGARAHPIWPVPREARYSEERLLLRDAVVVVPDGDRRAQLPGRLLAEQIADEFGVAIPVVGGGGPPAGAEGRGRSAR